MKKFVLLAAIALLAMTATSAQAAPPVHLHQKTKHVVSAPAPICPRVNGELPCSTSTAIAECPQGYRVTGGGVTQSNATDATLISSHPVKGGWEVTMTGNTAGAEGPPTGYTFHAVAVCSLIWLTR